VTYYPLSAYGANVNEGKNDLDAQQRGWGRGWPNCQSGAMVTISSAGETLKVHRNLKDLFVVLMNNTERRFGYNIHTAYGYACRNISGQNIASNHSWGLAVDINPLQNPQRTTFRCEIPPGAVKMWEVCGFYWGGRYKITKDTMHFEYIFRPSDVAADLVQAKKYAVYTPPPFPVGLAPNKSVPSAVGLQRALKKTGFLSTSVAESANYGPATQQAVARFHNRYTQFRAPGTTYDPAIGPTGWKHLHILAYT
jgi:hypothetical protein